MVESRPADGDGGRADARSLYHDLFQQGPFPIAVFGADGRWVSANDAFHTMIGDDPPPGYNLLEDKVVESRGTMDLVRRAFAGDTVRFPPRWHQGRAWMAPGDKVPHVAFERTLFPIRAADGVITHVALCHRDVTAQLVRQEKRDEQASRVLESAMVGVWIFDRHGATTFMNARMAGILGLTPAEVATTPAAELVPPATAATLGERLAAVDGGSSITGEQRFRRRDGTEGWAMFESGPVFDAEGRFDGVLATVIDVTERRLAEEAVRRSERRFRRLAEGGALGIIITDLDGRILDANDAFLAIIGYTRADLSSGRLRWTDLTPPEWRLLDERAGEQLRRTGVTAAWEKEYVRKDGTRVPVLVGVTALAATTSECIAFILDQTERKRAEAALRAAEAQLRQAQKMEAVGRLAGGIAHDFNNLLSVILSYCDALIAGWDPTSTADDIAQIRKAAVRAAQLTRQLLAFSRQQVLKLTLVDVNAVVESLLGLLGRVLGPDVEIRKELSEPLWGVTADAAQLEQVLVNLVLNARDAMPSGGTLTIETANVDLDAKAAAEHPGLAPGPYVRIAVRDTGIGMDSSVRARVFDPFFTTKDAGRGTGLGLSSAFGIVQQFGGDITVESEPGAGSTFTVHLPRRAATTVTPPQPARPGPGPGTTETILLVDDDEQVRGAATRILTRAGYRVLVADSAETALALSDRHEGPIHLLLTDVVLPGKNGRDLAERVTVRRPETRVLYTSGYTGDGAVRRSALEETASFVPKPWTAEALARKVREVLDRAEGQAEG